MKVFRVGRQGSRYALRFVMKLGVIDKSEPRWNETAAR